MLGEPQGIAVDRRDLGLFVACSVLGLGVLLTSLMGVRGIWIHLGVAVVMVSYAVLTWLTPNLRLRLDQAGDNAYYLGLLFTLISMAIALSKTEESTDIVGQLLPAFGVAITSTILGVFLRILLHQMRVDPVDIEEVARQELAQAASKLKGSLDLSMRSFSNFPTELTAITRDTVRDVLGSWSKLVQENVEGARHALQAEMVAVASVAGELQSMQVSMRNEFAGLLKNVGAVSSALGESVAQLEKIKVPPTKLATVLDKTTLAVASATAELEDAQVLLGSAVRGVSAATEEARQSVAGIVSLLDEVRTREMNAAGANAEAMRLLLNASKELATEVSAGSRMLEPLRLAAINSTTEHLKLQQSSSATLDGLAKAVETLSASIAELGGGRG